MQKVIETTTYVIFDNLHKEYFASEGNTDYFTPNIEEARKFIDENDVKWVVEELIDDYWWAQEAGELTFLVKKCIVTQKYEIEEN